MISVSILTFGCAMNFYDTEVAEGILEKAGYRIVTQVPLPKVRGLQSLSDCQKRDEPGTFGRGTGAVKADVVLMNTCSVREHAEERVFGRLGMLGKLKKQNPNLIIGLMGCMVEEHRERLFKRFPQIDLMVGTRNIKELPALLEEVRRRRLLSVGARHAVPLQIANIKQDGISIEYTDQIKRQGRFHAWLPIMTGCNKVCTFCIVPKTRGREVSMPICEVCREAERLAGEGVKWITLLGQNVNSYQQDVSRNAKREYEMNDRAPMLVQRAQELERHACWPREERERDKEVPTAFPMLLERLCQIPGLERISFTTSHPQDATRELFETIARNPKISRRFHLPLQSGSDKILKRMKRLHTYAEYKEKVELLRKLVPDISITTDIIAGFSGESEEDHGATLAALRQIRFDDAYIYKYSVREGTPAAKLKADVPLAVKERRNGELLALQRKISRENHEKFLGKTVEVFAEQRSPKDKAKLRGRAADERKIVFAGGQELLGTFQNVVIEVLRHETFLGKRVNESAGCEKGD